MRSRTDAVLMYSVVVENVQVMSLNVGISSDIPKAIKFKFKQELGALIVLVAII